VTAAYPKFLNYDGPKAAKHNPDKSDPDSHGDGHYPEAMLVRRKSSPDATGKDVRGNYIPNPKAENHGRVHDNISLPTVLTDSSHVHAMLFGDALKQRLHTFVLSRSPLR